ncbi:polysaccharide biosynthesis C-terminal domain-containing protein [Rhodococcus sp. MALMAid1271]|uniref:oligosaccharide flippase family protein n=1 Tax=Rhodococcus sp. MALMAid1271 TaxID=3411744 RepID=UPI003BA12F6F
MSRQAILLFATQMVVAIANLPVTIVLARALGPSGLGTYQLYNRIALVTIAVACLGYPHAIAWASGSASTAGQRGAVLRVVYRSTALSAIFVIATYGLLGLIPSEITGTTNWYLFGVFAILNIFAANLSNYFRGFLDITGMAFCRISQAVSWLVLSVVLAVTQSLSITTAACALLASQTIAIGLSFVRLGVSGTLRISIEPISRKEISSFSRRVFPGLLVREWSSHLDQLVIGFVLSTYALGIYTVAASLTLALALLTGPIVNTAQPIVQATSTADRSNVVTKFYAATILVIGTPSVIVAALAYVLVPMIYGSSFTGSVQLAQILCISAFFSAIAACGQGILVGAGYPGSGSIGTAIGFATTCGLWILLIPHYALVGVAWSSAIGMGVSACFTFSVVAKRVDVKFLALAVGVIKDASSVVRDILISPKSLLHDLGLSRKNSGDDEL